MRRRILLSLPSLLAPLLISCGGSSDSAATSDSGVKLAGASAAKTDKSADEAAIRAIYEKMAGQMNATDATGITALFADDGSEMMPGMPAARGHDAIQKLMTTVFSSMKNLKVTIGASNVAVSDAGDLAVITAPYQISSTDAKGKKLTDHGTTMTIFRKINGQWKILYDANVSEVGQ
jgi:uncharacterized protein (TIGR02246 family)